VHDVAVLIGSGVLQLLLPESEFLDETRPPLLQPFGFTFKLVRI